MRFKWKSRLHYLHDTQFRWNRGVAVVVVVFLWGSAQTYDFLVNQIAKEPGHWWRARDVLELLPWYGWAIIALVVVAGLFFEGGFQAATKHDERIAELEKPRSQFRLKVQSTDRQGDEYQTVRGVFWGLVIANEEDTDADECIGALVDATEGFRGERLPTNRTLEWSGLPYGRIGAKQEAILKVASLIPIWDHEIVPDIVTWDMELAYEENENFRRRFPLPWHDILLLLLRVSAKDRLPTYAVCRLYTRLDVNIHTGFRLELLDICETRPSLRDYPKIENNESTQ